MTAIDFDVRPVAGRIGAQIIGVDIADDLDDTTVAQIRQALLTHRVVFFRGQHLDAAGQVRFGEHFAEVTSAHPTVPPFAGHDKVLDIRYEAGGSRANRWHSDVTFVERPPLGSILRAVTLPPHGGDTNWADLELAFASLAEPVQRLAEQLTAVHDGSREFGYYLAQRRQGEGSLWEGERYRRLDPVEHPVVRVHPETGRKSLFVNPGFVSHIVGVSDAESRHLLDLFYAHLTKPEHVVGHRWRLGDVAMWDNRATAHYANRDYGDARRVMHRITLRGDEPVGVGALR
jgi:alpha-ketoglutarate-dependent taurine dioxygenase